MDRYVYSLNEGSRDMESLIGAKGAALSEMIGMGLPIPYGIIVTSGACRDYYENGDPFISQIKSEIFEKLADLEKVAGRRFGDPSDPLVLSLRSTSTLNMPGIMPTILDLGLNDDTVNGLARRFGNVKMAFDCYRRFIRTYGRIVLGIDRDVFDASLMRALREAGVSSAGDLGGAAMKDIVTEHKKIVAEVTGQDFPQDVNEQLLCSLKGIFDSWYTEKARMYRKINNISDSNGTAVCIQRMVFGNIDESSGTGALFTRDPITGRPGIRGEYMKGAQGEDLVSGFRTPEPLSVISETHPIIHEDLIKISSLLEDYYADVQNIEFTIENGKLYIMQTKAADRTAISAVKTAVDMVREGLISKREAMMRVEPEQMKKLLERNFSENVLSGAEIIAHGMPSSPGAASGAICFSSADAQSAAAQGTKVILVRRETSPEDIAGMFVSEGLLTEEGGIASHASALARSFGTCCVTGADIIVDEKNKLLRTDKNVFREGDIISIDGMTGFVYRGSLKIEEPKIAGEIETLLEWVDKERKLDVYANVDNIRDAELALKFGAEGIGLCRTERMFLDDEMIYSLWKLLLSENAEQRADSLSEMSVFINKKVKHFYRIMRDKPVVFALLDPPLHEYIPKTNEDMELMADRTGIRIDTIRRRVHEVSEFNPMLGERGARLLIKHSDIVEMQIEAITDAAVSMQDELDIEITPCILVPFLSDAGEFKEIKKIVLRVFDNRKSDKADDMEIKIGAMIEVPRAALTADKITEDADFLSFGTNDLTQMTFGFSRDDSTGVIVGYRVKDILSSDPFVSLDKEGVGYLMEKAADLARNVKSNIKMSICGEQAIDPGAIRFCTKLGFSSLSCSAYMIPVARLSAGRVAIRAKAGLEDNGDN